MDRPQYALYLSHSWLPELVEVNMAVWDLISEDTRLLVDDNRDESPPFYVNRIEHLIRESDLFLAIVTPADGRTPGPTPSGSGRRISPYVMFEIELAQRARLPSLILYDDVLDMQLSMSASPQTEYISFNSRRTGDVARRVGPGLGEWMRTITSAGPPRRRRQSKRATILLPSFHDVTQVIAAISDALASADYSDVQNIGAYASDVDTLGYLRLTDLLVTDISDSSVWDIYGMAHALALPAIRMRRGQAPVKLSSLPRLLRGGVVGFHDDVQSWSTADDAGSLVSERARSNRQPMIEIDDRDQGYQYFKHRRLAGVRNGSWQGS
jgi:hypothetical protein